MPSSRPLSIFDLDRTLTRYGTWSPFLLFAARRRAPWRLAFAPLVLVLMAAYKARLLSRKRLKQAMQRLMLGSAIDLDSLTCLAGAYAEESLARNIHPGAIASIAAERAAGRRIVIASAAHLFYLEAIAERLGVADVVGTASIWHGRNLTPQIAGENCYGKDKRLMLERWLAGQEIDRADVHIRFFSDDLSDLPTFEWADEAVAVNSSQKLLQLALRRGWTIYDWRQPRSARAGNRTIGRTALG
nr:HAD-IB family hydrolase [Sphingopyxis panaciterrae]